MFSLCVSVHRGGVLSHNALGVLDPPPAPAPPPRPRPPPTAAPPPPAPAPPPPPNKVLDKKFWTKSFGQKSFGQKIGQTLWKLLEVGGAGGTPLVTDAGVGIEVNLTCMARLGSLTQEVVGSNDQYFVNEN